MFRYDNEYTIKKMGEGLFDRIIFKGKSPYAGLEVQYGRVQFIEEDDHLRLKFEYEVFENPRSHKRDDKMTNYLGRVLFEILEQEVTYADAVKGKE